MTLCSFKSKRMNEEKIKGKESSFQSFSEFGKGKMMSKEIFRTKDIKTGTNKHWTSFLSKIF